MTAVVHRRLFRDPERRLVAGVAAGLAGHLRLDVVVVRIGFVLLAAVQGAGLLVYAAFWILVPLGGRSDPSAPASRWSRRTQAVALGGLVVVGAVVAGTTGLWVGDAGTPALIAVVGLALIWRQADEAQRARWAAASRRFASGPGLGGPLGVLRLVVGGLLVAAGMAGFLATQHALGAARRGILSTVVVVAGVALVTAPWWWRLARELADERRERIRSEERAELAARVHDSVLHTLALIQRHADDPGRVQRLARGSERELRTWLYRPPADAADRLGSAVESTAAEVEDLHGLAIEVVGVGDRVLDDRLRALVLAAREAMVNAAKASTAAGASVFYEVEAERVTLFVRDRGRGFDPAAVPADRYGIRESIVGRMQRHGGTATVRSAPGEGTEVELVLPVPAARSGS